MSGPNLSQYFAQSADPGTAASFFEGIARKSERGGTRSQIRIS